MEPTGRRRWWATLAAASLVTSGLAMSPATAAPTAPEGSSPEAKIDSGVSEQMEAEGRADVWVRFGERPDMTQFEGIADWDARGQAVVDALTAAAESSQDEVRERLDAEGVTYEAFWATNSIRVSGADQGLVSDLAQESEIEGIYPTMQIEVPEIVPTTPEMAPNAIEWGVADINAPEVWGDGYDGQDIVVASIDTGAQWDHPALINQYRGNLGGGEVDHNYSWFDYAGTRPAPVDTDGHGTHVTGTMVGTDGGNNQIGVAPGAKWIAANGCCPDDAALIASGQWMLAPTDLAGENPDVSMRPHIINNSWGTTAPSNDPFMEDIIEAWAAAGQFGVFANGNSGPSCNTSGSPGSRTIAYSVGNYNSSHTISGSSSRGAGQDGTIKPNISAPGSAVRSSVPGSGYAVYSGTSMASPHVAGAVALVWSASPTLTGDVEGTRDLLNGTAIDTANDQCGGTPENNNVFGEGRLDAQALVNDAPIDGGTLTGVVTDASDASAIAGASVHVVGEMERTLTTNSEGAYNAALAEGEYDLTISAFGYETHTQTVTIEADETQTVNVALDPAETGTLSGVVTDGSGYGFPLYARIAVQGTDEATYTDPETGEYSLDIPSGATYTLTVQVQYDGYTTPAREVTVDGNATEDFAVPVDSVTCSAPGYHIETDGLWETFDEEALPEGWEIIDHLDNGNVWRFDNHGNRGNLTGGEGGFAIANSDAYGSGTQTHTTLVTPSLDLSGDQTPAVGFNMDYHHLSTSSATVELSLDGGETWQDVQQWTASARGPREELVPLPEAAGESDVRIGFTYHAPGWHWWWQLDDVFVGERACVPAGDGGYVVGNVYDNADEGIVGATVTNADADGQTATTVATPGDENLDDGFYWIFSDTTGENTFEASANNYETQSQSVTVVDGDAVRADFTLGSGMISVEPTQIESTQDQDEVVEHTLTVTNDGTGAAEVELVMRDGGFVAPTGVGVDTEPVTLDVPTSLAAFAGDETAVGTYAQDGFAPSDTWESLPNYPQVAMDNRMVNLDGTYYSLGGTTGTAAFANVYRYEAGSWEAAASLPQAASAVNAEAVGDQIVVSGGWVASATTGNTYVYDAGADTWTQVTSAPTSVSASGTAVIDGIMYVVGGCTTSDCSPMSNNAMAYDVANDSWETLANYPTAAAFNVCGAVDGQLVCTGGNPGSGGIASTYTYDPGTDSWASAPAAPTPHWAAGAATANGQLVVQGGVQGAGAGAVSNATYAFDGAAWTTLAPAQTPVYRGDISCGIGKVGGSTGGFTPVANAEQLPGWDDCATFSDVEWIELDPQSFVVEAGDSVDVTVTTDSTGLDIGTYEAEIRVLSNTPQSAIDVPVTMTVTGELPGVPAIEVDPESVDSTQEEDEVTEHDLTISNTGTAELSWTIDEAEAEADATGGATVSLPQGADRASGLEVQDQAPQQVLPTADPAATGTLSEGFEDVEGLPAAGWAMVNNSEPVGLVNWFQGNPDVFSSHQGAADAYVGSNFNAAGTSPGHISTWLMTPELELVNGSEFNFWTRGTGSEWADRLEVRLSTNGASTDAGTGFDGVGDFTERLLVINENLGSDYPAVWTEYTVEIEGLEESTTGRLAFRYHVPNGGPVGINSDYIGIDTVSYEAADDGPPPPPPACEVPTDISWLSVDPASGTTAAGETSTVTVTLDATGVEPGDYEAQLCVTSDDPSTPLVQVPVTMTVEEAVPVPEGFIEVDPTSVEHEVGIDGSQTTDVIFSNTGEGAAEVGLSHDADWLSVDPAAFDVAAEDSVNVAFTTDAAGMEPGTYTTEVDITTDTGQDLAPVSVTMTVLEAPVEPVEVERWAGANRYETAVAVSSTYEPGVPVVFVATGDAYPDALTGSALAGSLNGPVLLTKSGNLTGVTGAELARLQPERVVVLGGTSAVSDVVLAQAGAAAGVPAERLSGVNRYGTAAAVSAEFGTAERVFVATGEDYPDALSAAARAGAVDAPVLLVKRDAIPSATAAALDALEPSQITVLGGEGAVDQSVVEELRSWAPTKRMGGLNRYVTSVRLFAEVASAETVYVASGQNWPDALSGGAKAGSDSEPLLLTKQDLVPQVIMGALQRLDPDRVVVLGGESAVSEDVVEQLEGLRD